MTFRSRQWRVTAESVGTPFPIEPSSWHLIVGGLYRYVRNPMHLAFVAAIIGQALSSPLERGGPYPICTGRSHDRSEADVAHSRQIGAGSGGAGPAGHGHQQDGGDREAGQRSDRRRCPATGRQPTSPCVTCTSSSKPSTDRRAPCRCLGC